MTTVHRFASRQLRRAALIATLCTVAPAVAEPPKRPARLPQVTPTLPTETATSVEQPTGPVDATPKLLLSTQEVKARVAAMKTVPVVAPTQAQPAPTRWLPTTTANSQFETARQHLANASRAYDVGAWLSAESETWEALRHAAEAIDQYRRESGRNTNLHNSATAKLRVARKAIIEARDFNRWSAPNDANAIARTARSHSTTVLHNVDTAGLTATEAADRYLDTARVAMSQLAGESIEAARAMDLLAATLLTRNETKQLPGPTALCLRRAALQGQPQNASLAFRLGTHLAAIGLWNEAEWALQHSLTLEPNATTASTLASVYRRSGKSDAAEQLLATYRYQAAPRPAVQAPQIPQITQLSPEQFAAVSPPVMSGQPEATVPAAQVASAISESQAQAPPADEKKPGKIRSFFGSLRSVW